VLRYNGNCFHGSDVNTIQSFLHQNRYTHKVQQLLGGYQNRLAQVDTIESALYTSSHRFPDHIQRRKSTTSTSFIRKSLERGKIPRKLATSLSNVALTSRMHKQNEKDTKTDVIANDPINGDTSSTSSINLPPNAKDTTRQLKYENAVLRARLHAGKLKGNHSGSYVATLFEKKSKQAKTLKISKSPTSSQDSPMNGNSSRIATRRATR